MGLVYGLDTNSFFVDQNHFLNQLQSEEGENLMFVGTAPVNFDFRDFLHDTSCSAKAFC